MTATVVPATLAPGSGGALLVGLFTAAAVAAASGLWIWGLAASLSWPDWAFRRAKMSKTGWAIAYVVFTPISLIAYVFWLRGRLHRAMTEGPRRAPVVLARTPTSAGRVSAPVAVSERGPLPVPTRPTPARGAPLIDLRDGMAVIDLRGSALVECASCRRLASPGASYCRVCSAPLPRSASGEHVLVR